MELSGTHRFDVSAEQLWEALQDPDVLARTLPGCDQLTATADTTWEALVKVGVGSIRGTYRGTVELTDLEPPHAWKMRVQGAGAPGTVDADIAIRLEPAEPSGVDLHWEAQAVVGGMIGGVGQRMLAAAARRTADQFFRAVEDDFAASGARSDAAPAADSHPDATSPATHDDEDPDDGRDGAGLGIEEAKVTLGKHFSATARRPSAQPTAGVSGDDHGARTVLAALVGGALALAGVIIGKRLSSSSRSGSRR